LTVKGWSITGLMNTGIEVKITHQLFGTREPMDVADGRQYAAGHHSVNATDRHQSLYLWIDESAFALAAQPGESKGQLELAAHCLIAACPLNVLDREVFGSPGKARWDQRANA
jgi:hypothetical protein